MSGRAQSLHLPLDAAAVRALEVGDFVTVSGEITISIGLPAHARLARDLREGRTPPVDLRAGAFFHLSAFVVDGAGGEPARALYMNPSTSTRYNAHMPDIIRGFGLRLAGGKGGLDAASVEAMREVGCVYLSFLGGGATLLSEAIRGVVATHWNEYISQFRLTTLRVDSLGPAVVAIDARGHSVYQSLHEQAADRLPRIREALAVQRERDRSAASGHSHPEEPR